VGARIRRTHYTVLGQEADKNTTKLTQGFEGSLEIVARCVRRDTLDLERELVDII
jgi:hypothetical protein